MAVGAVGIMQGFFIQGAYYYGKKLVMPWLASFERSIFVGAAYIGVAAFVYEPSLATAPLILASYTPHAYNLIIWPLVALFVLGRRFSPKLLVPVFAMVYGLDEIAWNGFAFVRFAWTPDAFQFSPRGPLWFMPTTYWLSFISVMAACFILGLVFLQPRFIRLRITVPVVLSFGLFWGFIADFPLAGYGPTFSIAGLAFELMWQAVWWFFVIVSVFPGNDATKIPVENRTGRVD